MRYHSLILFSIISIGFAGCSKTADSACPTCCDLAMETKLSGSWELRLQYGGKRPDNETESLPGNGDIYSFSADTYRHYENHILKSEGLFTLTTSRGPENANPIDAIVFNETDTVTFIIENDKLTLNPRAPIYDGMASQYEKTGGK